MRVVLACLVAGGLGCGAGHEPVVAQVGQARAAAASPAAESDEGDQGGEAACDRAARWVVRAGELHRAGWQHRPRRLVTRAEALCPSAVDATTRQVFADDDAGPWSDAVMARRIKTGLIEHEQTRLGARARIIERPLGRLVGVARDDSRVLVAVDTDRHPRRSSVAVLDGADGGVRYVIDTARWVQSADMVGERLITCDEGSIALWSLRSGALERELRWTDERYTWVALTHDAQRVVAVGEHGRGEGIVRVFDAATGDALGSVAPAEAGSLESAALIDDEHLVVASEVAMYRVDLKTFTVTREIDAADLADPIVSVAATAARLAALWGTVAVAHDIEGVALSHSFAVSREVRADGDDRVVFDTWYRGQHRRLEADGYRGEVFALTPAGDQLAAVVSRDAWLWDLTSGEGQRLATPDARGFPDALSFAADGVLRLVFERPAASFRAAPPYRDWQSDLAPGKLDGFSGTAVSIQGDVVTKDNGVVTLAKAHKELSRTALAFAFSGDGQRIFVSTKGRIRWFDRDGRPLGEQGLGCTPGALAADRTGRVVAMKCGDDVLTFRPPSTVRTFQRPDGARLDIDALHMSPRGDLIVVRGDHRVSFIRSADLVLLADLEFSGGEPLVTTPDGRVQYWDDDAAWRSAKSCRVGYRAFPVDDCLDLLVDDTLLETVLDP